MWKIIIFGLMAYILYKLFANDFLKKRKIDEKKEEEERKRKMECGEMVQDPECGVYVDVDSSISVKDGNKTYYFCSYDCRDKFLERLEKGGAELPPNKKGARDD